MNLRPDETEITGGWKWDGERVSADENIHRIRWLKEHSLEKLATGNWTILYRDKSDGRLWQLFYSHGELQAGGPESLRLMSPEDAAKEYGQIFPITKSSTGTEEHTDGK